MADPAPHRVGQPNPLIFHLGAALTGYGQALAAAPRADAPDFPWSAALAAEAAAIGPDLDRIELAAEIARRLAATLRGLETWQRHPYRRALREPPTIWSAGSSRLLDYGACAEATDPAGPPVLVAPSLINRAYILDLTQDASLLRWLAARGLRPVLLDWGAPGPGEAGFDLERYGAARLAPALDFLRARAGRSVAVLGYCMGGTLAAGLAARAPQGVARLALIGAPWDFSSTDGMAGGLRALVRARGAADAATMIERMGQVFGSVPVSVFQMLFALINPLQAALKFRRLAEMNPKSAAARRFVAIEDWLADGVPMAAPAARDLLIGWHIENRTARGAWRFLGGTVRPGEIAAPTLAFCGRADSIAPPRLAEGLPEAIPGATILRPATGHVGMVVGGGARSEVWRPMADFLAGGRA